MNAKTASHFIQYDSDTASATAALSKLKIFDFDIPRNLPYRRIWLYQEARLTAVHDFLVQATVQLLTQGEPNMILPASLSSVADASGIVTAGVASAFCNSTTALRGGIFLNPAVNSAQTSPVAIGPVDVCSDADRFLAYIDKVIENPAFAGNFLGHRWWVGILSSNHPLS
jgi:hypothetical protein